MPNQRMDTGDIYMLQADKGVLEKYRKRLNLSKKISKKYVRIVSSFSDQKNSKVRKDKQVTKNNNNNKRRAKLN